MPRAPDPLPRACLNCGADLVGPFCHACGQRNRPARQSIWILLREAFEETFELDGRVARTLVPFVSRPGFLMREYAAGRRARYSSPLRLFLAFSLLWFAVGWVDRQLEEMGRIAGVESSEPASGLQFRRSEPSAPVAEGELPDTVWGQELQRRIEDFDRLEDEKKGELLADALFEYIPTLAFALVPLFAGFLQLLFARRGRYYVEHLVFALHLHAYAFLVAALALVLPWDAAQVLLVLTVPVHLLVGLWKGYELGFGGALLRFVPLCLAYGAALLFGLVATLGLAVING